jgi:hypothetical protein
LVVSGRPAEGSRGRQTPIISGRDAAILSDLKRLRLLSGRQVERLHFTAGSALTRARRCRRTLARLTDSGVLHRFARRVGGLYGGSADYVYGLDSLGQRLSDSRGPAGGSRRRRPWEPSSLFVAHVLAVSELYVKLREQERESATKLLQFDAEPLCWRIWKEWSGEALVVKPDAFVVTLSGDDEYLTFVELDRSTQSRPVIRRKAEAYTAYWQSGHEQQRHAVFPQVLFVALDERRKAQLVDVLGQLDPEAWQLFRVCRAQDAAHVLSGRSPPDAN